MRKELLLWLSVLKTWRLRLLDPIDSQKCSLDGDYANFETLVLRIQLIVQLSLLSSIAP